MVSCACVDWPAAPFLAGAFLTGAFLAGAFLAGAFLAGAFLAGAFLTEAFLAGDVLAGDFLTLGALAAAVGRGAAPVGLGGRPAAAARRESHPRINTSSAPSACSRLTAPLSQSSAASAYMGLGELDGGHRLPAEVGIVFDQFPEPGIGEVAEHWRPRADLAAQESSLCLLHARVMPCGSHEGPDQNALVGHHVEVAVHPDPRVVVDGFALEGGGGGFVHGDEGVGVALVDRHQQADPVREVSVEDRPGDAQALDHRFDLDRSRPTGDQQVPAGIDQRLAPLVGREAPGPSRPVGSGGVTTRAHRQRPYLGAEPDSPTP